MSDYFKTRSAAISLFIMALSVLFLTAALFLTEGCAVISNITCRAPYVLMSGGCSNSSPSPSPSPSSTIAATWPVQLYEAESGTPQGNATIVGASEGTSRAVGDLAGEASGRQAVILPGQGDAISMVATMSSNAVVIRYSIPDAPGGGGQQDILGLSMTDNNGNSIYPQQSLTLTSRYSWLYGINSSSPLTLSSCYPSVYGTSSKALFAGVKLVNLPLTLASSLPSGCQPFQTHLYDEVQLQLTQTIPAGTHFTLTNLTQKNNSYTIDFIELEMIPAPIPQPSSFLSFVNDCGGTATGKQPSMSGSDDTLFGSVFNRITSPTAINPFNPTGAQVLEKAWYSTQSSDPVQDSQMNAIADENTKSLINCIAKVGASSGQYSGVYLPPGRYYARGAINLPSATVIQGAGMWYSKFVAVDTAAPTAVTNTSTEITGIKGVSGNLTFTNSAGAAADKINLSNFSIFGNSTNRDDVGYPGSGPLQGEFTHSTFDHLWIEHTVTGIQLHDNSNQVVITNTRVRNTLADGLDFFDGTSNSSINQCQVRGTGDDAVAIWSSPAQSNHFTGPASTNSVTNTDTRLPWIGHGFAVYGGQNNTISNGTVSDTLTFPCLDLSNEFAPYPVTQMIASASNLVLSRCGGNEYNNSYGGLFIDAVDNTAVPSLQLTLNQISVLSPTYSAIDIRRSGVTTGSSPAILQLNFNNISILNNISGANNINTPSTLQGQSSSSNICSYTSAQSVPVACSIPSLTNFTSNNSSSCPTSGLPIY